MKNIRFSATPIELKTVFFTTTFTIFFVRGITKQNVFRLAPLHMPFYSHNQIQSIQNFQGFTTPPYPSSDRIGIEPLTAPDKFTNTKSFHWSWPGYFKVCLFCCRGRHHSFPFWEVLYISSSLIITTIKAVFLSTKKIGKE